MYYHAQTKTQTLMTFKHNVKTLIEIFANLEVIRKISNFASKNRRSYFVLLT